MVNEVIKAEKEYVCCICGKPTHFIEINYEAPFCSDECIHEMDKQSDKENKKMTENQAISKIQYRIDTASEIAGKGADGKAFEDLELAIKALEDIQKYKAIGTPGTIKATIDRMWEAIDTYTAYSEIGTVEELKMLASKGRAYDQVAWERDVAIEQLREIGISLGQKMDDVIAAVERQTNICE